MKSEKNHTKEAVCTRTHNHGDSKFELFGRVFSGDRDQDHPHGKEMQKSKMAPKDTFEAHPVLVNMNLFGWK